MTEISIADRLIGSGHPVFVIAELSANHNHDLDLARRTIDAAAKAGANAIKLQTYTPDTLTFPSDAEPFQVRGGTAWDGQTLYDLYSAAYTPWEWHEDLFAHAAEVGLVCFSTPFDPTAVELLQRLDAPAYKIASMEVADTPLIEGVARCGKPVIISTGIATEDEIHAAVAACHAAGNRNIVLLKCTSAYPTPLAELNLRTIPDMRSRFGTLVGLSDHTTDHTAAIVSTALGACMIEKHLILDRSLGGPDSSFSMEPAEFAAMVDLVRDAETALGDVSYELAPSARVSRSHARSLFVVADVEPGDLVSESTVRSIRPADGLPPAAFTEIAGRAFARAVSAGTPLSWDMMT